MHIAMIGGTGRVGGVALERFLRKYACEVPTSGLHISLFSPNYRKSNILLTDIKQSIPLDRQRNLDKIFIHSTELYEDLSGADLVVILASAPAPSDEQIKELIATHDIEHRTALSFANRSLIEDISQKLHLFTPRAHVVVATNQSDLMAEIVRMHLPPENVMGFGGIVDSYRLRTFLRPRINRVLYEQMSDILEKSHMIGYHNDDMIILGSSISAAGMADSALNDLTQDVRMEGFKLTQMYGGADSRTNKPTTPYIAPGSALAITMAAFTGLLPQDESPFIESFNVVLNEKQAAIYGVTTGTAISVPVLIENGKYTIIENIDISPKEQEHLLGASKRMKQNFERLISADLTRLTEAVRPTFGGEPAARTAIDKSLPKYVPRS